MLRTLSKPRVRQNVLGVMTREFSMSPVLSRTRPKRIPPAPISTLIPAQLTSNDYLDISGKSAVNVTYRNASCPDLHWEHPELKKLPFPNKSHGFFYYHSPENALNVAGGLRFRVCPSSDPKMFQQGHDLLKRNGFPWEVPNWSIALNESYHPFGEELLKSGVIRTGALDLCRKLASPFELRTQPTSPIIYALKQPFPVTLGQKRTQLWITNGEKLIRWAIDLRITEWMGPPTEDVVHLCLDRERDDLLLRLLYTPPGCAGLMRYKVGATTRFHLTSRLREILDVLENTPYDGTFAGK
ncbi:hypothetical protein D9758_008068 [Tetrapyrgos nigripes]|uniref:Uncharacterized protein n=1 Tax=Tetrapyrgos nigripes TaxID=182062 RepID=A0A8H5D0L2_9AGAR|nr:hypothetical protein D9758_008068 [Tetrapyrgos nigripes]